MDILAALKNTVPISQFNRGLAGKIFSDVRQSGAKVVMKNNVPECVLLSPQEYLALMDEVNDARLLLLAEKRMQSYDPAAVLSGAEVQAHLGITDAELDAMDEVEFE